MLKNASNERGGFCRIPAQNCPLRGTETPEKGTLLGIGCHSLLLCKVVEVSLSKVAGKRVWSAPGSLTLSLLKVLPRPCRTGKIWSRQGAGKTLSSWLGKVRAIPASKTSMPRFCCVHRRQTRSTQNTGPGQFSLTLLLGDEDTKEVEVLSIGSVLRKLN